MNVKIKSAELDVAVNKATLLAEKMQTAYEDAERIKMLIDKSYWSGEAKEACQDYLGIVIQYHKDLVKQTKTSRKIIKRVKKNIENYEKSDFVTKIKNF